MNELAYAIENVAHMAQLIMLGAAAIAAVVIVIYAVVRTP